MAVSKTLQEHWNPGTLLIWNKEYWALKILNSITIPSLVQMLCYKNHDALITCTPNIKLDKR